LCPVGVAVVFLVDVAGSTPTVAWFATAHQVVAVLCSAGVVLNEVIDFG
jgi:hypothetical protein